MHPTPIDSKNQPKAVLVIHGFTGQPETVRSIEQPLQKMGFHVVIPVLSGHGTNTPASLKGITWQDWFRDGENQLNELFHHYGPVILIGHSMGGLISIMLAARFPEKIERLVLVGAAILPDSPLAPGRMLHFLVPVAARFFSRWPIPAIYSDKKYNVNHPNYLWSPMDALLSFLALTGVARKNLGNIRLPLLIIQSKVDTRIDPQSAEIIFQETSTTEDQKQLVWFEKTDHEMFRDCETNNLISTITDYLKP
jgi:carboxylesterase